MSTPPNRNIFRRLSAFNISNRCEITFQNQVKSNMRTFIIFLLVFLISTPLLFVALWYSTECTVIFRNDDISVGGIREGKVLAEEDYPTEPIAVYNNGTIFYAGANNISIAYVQMLGFIVIDPTLFTTIRGNSSLMISMVLAVQSLMDISKSGYGSVSSFTQLPIYPYLSQYPTIFAIGNNQEIQNQTFVSYAHDVRFKITTGSYIIPLFMLKFFVTNLRDYPDHPNRLLETSILGIWRTSYLLNRSINQCQANHGSWSIEITDFIYHRASSINFINNDLTKMLAPNGTFPVEFEGTLTQNMFDLSTFFTSVTEYSTTKLDVPL